MALNPFGLSESQLARMTDGLETQGGLTPVDPGASALGRGTSNPFIFSNAVDVPNRAPGGPAASPTPLLSVQGRDGICRRWSVQVLARPVDLGALAVAICASIADQVRVRLTVGVTAVSFDADVPGGSCAFEVYAQAVDLAYINSDTQPPAAGPRRVLAVVSPVLAGQSSFPGMFPTRTVIYAIPAIIGAPVELPIPKFAQAVMFSAPPTAPFATEWRNTYGAGIAQGQTSTLWQQIPAGSGALAITSNPTGAAATVAAVYRLGV